MKETNGFIDLKARRDDIKSHALRCFDRITGLPKEIMPDVKYRTGVQVTVKQWGTARNQIFFSVYKPSEDAQFFSAEKLVRSHAHGDFASQNSQNPEEGEYAGSITVFINGVYTQVSVSGLIGEEDVAMAVLIMAYIFNLSPAEVCRHAVSHDAELPTEFGDKNHYLHHFVSWELVNQEELL